jgi:hypothetical protein
MSDHGFVKCLSVRQSSLQTRKYTKKSPSPAPYGFLGTVPGYSGIQTCSNETDTAPR